MKKIREMNEPELREYFKSLAKNIEEQLPPGPSNNGKCLFVILVADSIEPGVAQYVSNAERKDIIQFMRETAYRLERKEDILR